MDGGGYIIVFVVVVALLAAAVAGAKVHPFAGALVFATIIMLAWAAGLLNPSF